MYVWDCNPIGENHTVKELEYTCRDSEAALILGRPQLRYLSDQIVCSLPHLNINDLKEYDPSILRSDIELKLNDLDSDDALLLYTSGTTGRPKGVLMTLDNMKVIKMGSEKRLKLRGCSKLGSGVARIIW